MEGIRLSQDMSMVSSGGEKLKNSTVKRGKMLSGTQIENMDLLS
jgi:hypothetical protein